ncbi:ABC-F family ATP-binding cassette domain-containing protein [bacterium]|nr:ABC-F family ATP-binding cassette domain-containing protein [bacterium]
MIEIALNEIQKSYGVIKVLHGVSFDVQEGEKVGLIGRNGTGKTTIFKIIAGMENYDYGSLSIRKGSTVGYLEQIPDYPDDFKVIDVLNQAFETISKLRAEMKELEKVMAEADSKTSKKMMKRYGELQTKFEILDGYDIKVKLEKVCTGLQIDEEIQQRTFNTLSGGEKTTIMLARILLENPDILLLDEPTNHLDIESVEWLEVFLTEYKGTVIIIAHDRYFLDKVVTKIIELEGGETTTFNGNYSFYLEENERRLMAEFEAFKSQQKKIKAIEDAIKRLRDWGNRVDNPKIWKKVFNMEKRLERMDKLDKPTLEHQKIGLQFSSGSRSGKDVLRVKELRKSFDENLLIDKLDLNVVYQERVAILGKNGTGKSTLMKLLLKEIEPDAGEIRIGANVRLGHLEQEVTFEEPDKSVLQLFRENFPMYEGQARSKLAAFLFFGEDVFKPIKTLSGGEKVRLKLCILMQQDLNLLLLDEPTNHLDIDSREVFEEALNKFSGTALFISHDRYFINKVTDRIAEFRDRKLHDYPGNYDFYKMKKQMEKEKLAQNLPQKPAQKQAPDIEKEKEKDRKKLERQLSNLEKNIDKYTELINEKTREMEACESDYMKLHKLHREQVALKEKLDELYERWEEMHEKL